jgi:hypothetical protein
MAAAGREEKKTLTSFPAVFYSPPHLSQVFLNERLATLFSCTAAAPHSFIERSSLSAKFLFSHTRSFLCAQQHVCVLASHPRICTTRPKLHGIRKVALARVHSKIITRPTRIPLPGEYNVCARAVTGACLAGSGFWAAAAALFILCRRDT